MIHLNPPQAENKISQRMAATGPIRPTRLDSVVLVDESLCAIATDAKLATQAAANNLTNFRDMLRSFVTCFSMPFSKARKRRLWKSGYYCSHRWKTAVNSGETRKMLKLDIWRRAAAYQSSRSRFRAITKR